MLFLDSSRRKEVPATLDHFRPQAHLLVLPNRVSVLATIVPLVK